MNKVILIGNLGADPELRHTATGKAVCELRLATNESYTNGSGVLVQQTEWHRVIVWGKRAEAASKHLRKGREIAVEGRIQTRSWDDKEGVKRYTTEVIANDVRFLGGGRETKRETQDEVPSDVELGELGLGGDLQDDNIPM
jgi:single-strand DNA-binding protein